MPTVSHCMGQLYVNRLYVGPMLPVLLNQMDQKRSYSSAISIEGVVPG